MRPRRPGRAAGARRGVRVRLCGRVQRHDHGRLLAAIIWFASAVPNPTVGLGGAAELETDGGPRWTRTTYLRGRGHPALRPAILSGMPEILRVMGQATCRGEVQRRERGSLVATLNNPTTRPPPVCPQRTSSHRPPSTITPGSWPSSMVPSAEGYPATTIAEPLGYDPSTVRRWIQRFNHEGIAGLSDRPRSGRPRLGSPGSKRASDADWPSPGPGGAPHMRGFRWGAPPPPPLAARDLGRQGHPDAGPNPRHQWGSPSRGPHRSKLRWGAPRRVSMGSPQRRTLFGAIELARGRRSPPGPPAPASSSSWSGWWPPTPAGHRHPPRQRGHPPLPGGHPPARGVPPGPAHLRPSLLPSPQPGGADLGGDEDLPGQHPGGDHDGSGASGPGLLSGAG